MAKGESEILSEHFRDVNIFRKYQENKKRHDKKYVLRELHETTIHPDLGFKLKCDIMTALMVRQQEKPINCPADACNAINPVIDKFTKFDAAKGLKGEIKHLRQLNRNNIHPKLAADLISKLRKEFPVNREVDNRIQMIETLNIIDSFVKEQANED